ncbi:MAG: PSD1 and planctomycete cytochrome C domain-containing protein [Isosphaeraceae bacterium]
MRFLQRLRLSPLCPGFVTFLVLVLSGLGHPVDCSGGEAETEVRAAREKFFEQSVRPLLVENCYSCHAEKQQKGGLRLDSLESILKGGDSGPAVVPGKPDDSLMVEAIHYEGLEMPPTGRLAPEHVDVLTRWVSLGAPWPARNHMAMGSAPSPSRSVLTSGPPLWSLQPLRRPLVPDIGSGGSEGWSDWCRNPIDRFILNGLLDRGLTPTAEADKATLIRRVTFDLTGLPPSPKAIDAFLADEAPDAYERLVDRLLASPRYGQRWARHWLDLVRYAESDGYRSDAYRPAAWRYRDYVVRSFNGDRPYDRFLTEQLAGDELDPDDPELRVATGYFRLGPYEYNQRNVPGQWADILNDITDVTGEVFLGLSIGCARCHDHKFDPILQKDYYRLQAFFTPLLPRDDLPMARSKEWLEYQSRLATWEKAAAGILRELDAIARPHRDRGRASAIAKFPDEIKAILAKPEAGRTPLERQIGALAYRQISYEHEQVPALLKGPEKTRWTALQNELHRFDAMKPIEPGLVMSATDVGPEAPPTVIPGDRKNEPIQPGFLSALDPAPARIEPSPSAPRSTGRRLALARWLCRPENPLSTRVIVNRIWQGHFGRGLVGTSGDFGRLGETPSHPELLDWLTTEFVARGWRWKPIHRMILTSAAYRQAASRPGSELADAHRVDPENRLLWKRSSRRLDAEEIRDAMLAVSGELEPSLGGPSVEFSRARRTVETRVRRNARDPLLDAFDAPDASGTTSRRDTTTTSTQALLLINGGWTLARARALADRLVHFEPASIGDRARIVLAYRLTLGRGPDPEEIAEARMFLDRQARMSRLPSFRSGRDDRSALVDFCHVLLNSNAFLYID